MSYQAMKKARRKLKCIWLSDRSQSEKDTYRKFPTIYDILLKKKKIIETVKRLVVGRS